MQMTDPYIKLKNKRVLVTGGDGFLGRHLVGELRQACKEVFLYRQDVRSLDLYKKQFDIVCHLAGINRVDNDNSLNLLFDVNCRGTSAVMRYCDRTEARCVFASSAAVYTPASRRQLLGENAPAVPVSFYGMSKLLAENACRCYAQNSHISVTALRIFNMYGPGQKASFIIPYIIGRLKKKRPVMLKTPNTVIDFIFVQDVVRSFVSACAHEPKGFEAFNVGTGRGVKIHDLTKMIGRIMKVKPKIYVNGRAASQKYFIIADPGKAKKIIDWEPAVFIDEGVKLCL